jgi:hypothetical protein
MIGALGGVIALFRFYIELKAKPSNASIILKSHDRYGQTSIAFKGNRKGRNTALPRQIEIRKFMFVSNLGEESGLLKISVGKQKGGPKGLFEVLQVNLKICDADSSWDGTIDRRTGPLEVQLSVIGNLFTGYDDVAIAELLRGMRNHRVKIILYYTTMTPNLQADQKRLILTIGSGAIRKLILGHWYETSYERESKLLYRIATGNYPVPDEYLARMELG